MIFVGYILQSDLITPNQTLRALTLALFFQLMPLSNDNMLNEYFL